VPALPGVADMTAIDVTCARNGDGWSCAVRLADAASATEHTVRVTRGELARLAPADDEPTDLVRRSFEFLLAREPKESILRSFELPVIGRYFPEYEAAIKR
jgi:hypothetical protein